MTTRTAGASDGATWYPIHLIRPLSNKGLSAWLPSATNALPSRQIRDLWRAPIIQHGRSLGKTGVVVSHA